MAEEEKPEDAQQVSPQGFTVKASVHMPTKSGFVFVTSPERETPLTPMAARELAAHLMNAAACAEVDAWLLGFCADIIQMDWKDTIEMLASFRRYRRGEPDPVVPLSAEGTTGTIDLVH